MTRKLEIAFYGEGNTNSRVISIFINKILGSLHVTEAVHVIINPQLWNGRGEFIDTCVSLVRQAKPLHQLIVFHFDADGPDDTKVRRIKIAPLMQAIADRNLLDLPIIWAIPIHAIEAWLLVSPETFARALTNDSHRARELAFPRRPDQIHRAAVKELFKDGVFELLARTKRQRERIQADHFQEDVAEALDLDDLRRLPAFATFEQEVVRVLVDLGYVERG